MKKILLIGVIATFGFAGCAHTTPKPDPKPPEVTKTCKKGDPGYPKCGTGGGVSGPTGGGSTGTGPGGGGN